MVTVMLAELCRVVKKTNGIARRSLLVVCGALLFGGGCRTQSPSLQATASPAHLEQSDAAFAQALAHYSTGMLCDSHQDRAGAQAAFEAACRLDPDSRRPVDAAILNYLAQSRPVAALDTLESFCREHPDDADAHYALARLSELSGDFARAARHYAAAFRLSPDNLAAGYAWVRTLFLSGADRNAMRAMREVRRVDPSDEARNLPIYWALRFIRGEHAFARALPCIDMAIAEATDRVARVEYLIFYGDAAEASGDLRAAERAFERGLALDPGHVRAALALGHVRYARDGAEAVARQLRRTTDEAGNVDSWLTLAGLYLAAHDRTNALPALARADDLLHARGMTPSVSFYLLHGEILDELDRHDDAAIVFQEALLAHPRAHGIMNYLSYMWALEGRNLDLAAKLAQDAMFLRPHTGAYIDTLGWVRFRQQRFDEALDLLLQARAQMPDDSTVLDHVGDALAALRRTPEAGAYWARSYAADPSQTSVAEKLRILGIDPDRIPRLKPSDDNTTDSDEDWDDAE